MAGLVVGGVCEWVWKLRGEWYLLSLETTPILLVDYSWNFSVHVVLFYLKCKYKYLHKI